ncbi:DUF167 domain-containing protein [Roseococcus sp. SYP-B2431]|uniref:DUF167 domain-containing protein n=1 Tax=Roseococcus sp. SYP-B2431 TaxID=2496640 RepID=UPI00103BF1E2|nr:DUF167 domain-containing protein [Roseococcus sp. SYP-B2431]TCH96354.1 DUF167 domain-containing protein [Roseococcus sp. SYP-B2431]
MPVTPIARGVRLAVRLTPRASRDGVDGVVEGPDGRRMLQLRLTAPPVEGAANAALIAFVAKALGLRKSEVAIVSGQKARIKLLELSGDPAGLAGRVAAWIADST